MIVFVNLLHLYLFFVQFNCIPGYKQDRHAATLNYCFVRCTHYTSICRPVSNVVGGMKSLVNCVDGRVNILQFPYAGLGCSKNATTIYLHHICRHVLSMALKFTSLEKMKLLM